VIPTLADFLAWAANEPGLRAVYLDIKVPSGQGDAAVQILHEVQAAGLSVTVFAMSIHQDIVERMIPVSGALRIVWDFESDGALAGAEQLGLRELSVGLTPLRTESDVLAEIDDIVAARKNKRVDSVTVWTIDGPMQMALFLYRGVDAIMTNDPQRLYEIWQATL